MWKTELHVSMYVLGINARVYYAWFTAALHRRDTAEAMQSSPFRLAKGPLLLTRMTISEGETSIPTANKLGTQHTGNNYLQKPRF